VAEALLGRTGVFLMLTLWCFAVGCAFLPLRHRQPPVYAVPGLVLAGFLALLPPRLPGVFIMTLAATSIVMGPAVLLVSPFSEVTLRRGWISIALGASLLAITPSLPEGLQWAAAPLAPVLMLGIPIGAVLVVAPLAQRRRWVAPVCSSIAFCGSWVLWVARDNLYRLGS